MTSPMMLALADDELHVAETDVLRDLSAKFGFSPGEYETFREAASGYLTAIRTMEEVGRKRT